MSIKSDYELYTKCQKELSGRPTGHFWKNQEERYIEPFQIYGNLYYVGDSWVCVHLVDTGDGLLMIDAGNCGAEAMLVHSIWKLGFNPADVRWILLSHGHVDHFGAAAFFQNMFGTKIYMGEPDARMFKNAPWLSMIQESGECMRKLVDVDVLVQDGDTMSFGNIQVSFRLVPGHTKGCIACFFDVTDGKEKKRAGYYGGFGFNTLTEEYLTEVGDTSFEMRKIYIHSLEKVREEKVDIFVGNHTSNVNLAEKREYMLTHPRENPFVDREAWKKYLDLKSKEMSELIEKSGHNKIL